MDILESTDRYEAFLRDELGSDVAVEAGLREKRRHMAEDAPFPFLRATYWRWAERAPVLLRSLMDAPPVLAVGDIHLENYGTWRDDEGRLVWGVNDFDEAAEMPYALDLVRLATSALLAARIGDGANPTVIARAILAGYDKGLRAPRALVLDRRSEWLRTALIVPEQERARFWKKLDDGRKTFLEQPASERPNFGPRYRQALQAALPEFSETPEFWHRSAGLGSLGRPRWVARAAWRGDYVVREAKGVVTPAWTRAMGSGERSVRCMEIAAGRYRAPDPWYHVVDGVVVRRLSPNDRKIGAGKPADQARESSTERQVGRNVLLSARVLGAMARDLAAIHLGGADASNLIRKDMARRDGNWLVQAAELMAKDVRRDHKTFRKGWRP